METVPITVQLRKIASFYIALLDFYEDTGYPQDSYPHDGRADKYRLFYIALLDFYEDTGYPHDGRADKDSYPHDRRAVRILIRMTVVPINIDYYMSLVMRKPPFCKCENKDADQLCGNHTADQRLCFRYIDTQSLCFLNPNFKPLAIFSDCTARFVSDLVGNPEDRFSHNKTQMSVFIIPRINLRRPYQPETPVSARGPKE